MPGCNDSGGQNCRKVVHVKRPHFPDGTENYGFWGLAINFIPCDEDEITDENKGVVVMNLGVDSYDEDGDPIGKYLTGCCCNLFLNVFKCNSGTCCINFSDACPSEIPTWDAETEMLFVRGIDGTPAQGFCGYTRAGNDPNDPTDNCGLPANWVLSGDCAWCECPPEMGCTETNECECITSCGISYEDVTFSTIEYDPFFTGDICLFCKCFHLYTSCNNCSGVHHPEAPEGKCLEIHSCSPGYIPKNGMLFTHPLEGYGDQCGSHRRTECFEHSAMYTGDDYANSPQLQELPICTGGAYHANDWYHCPPGNYQYYEWDPCKTCNVVRWMPCANDTCVQRIDMWRADENHAEGFLDRGNVHPEEDGMHCCMTGGFPVSSQSIQGNFVWMSYNECHPTLETNCVLYGYPDYNCNYDCHDCPPEDEQMHPGCDCCGSRWGDAGCWDNCCTNPEHNHPPCDAEPLPLEEQGHGWEHPSLFPEIISTTIEIDIPHIYRKLDISFDSGRRVPHLNVDPLTDTWASNAREEHASRNPWRYKLATHGDTQNISDFAAVGAFAAEGVPHVTSALYLGNYTEDSTEWSAWCSVSSLISQTLQQQHIRVFGFTYTVFLYCVNNPCHTPSTSISKKGVVFQLDATYNE